MLINIITFYYIILCMLTTLITNKVFGNLNSFLCLAVFSTHIFLIPCSSVSSANNFSSRRTKIKNKKAKGWNLDLTESVAKPPLTSRAGILAHMTSFTQRRRKQTDKDIMLFKVRSLKMNRHLNNMANIYKLQK